MKFNQLVNYKIVCAFLFLFGFYHSIYSNAGILFWAVNKKGEPLALLYKKAEFPNYNVIGGKTAKWNDSKKFTAVTNTAEETNGFLGCWVYLLKRIENLDKKYIVKSFLPGARTPFVTYWLKVDYFSVCNLYKWNGKQNHFVWIKFSELINVMLKKPDANCFKDYYVCEGYPNKDKIYLHYLFIKGLLKGRNLYGQPTIEIIQKTILQFSNDSKKNSRFSFFSNPI
ncbi:hypothetical protein KAT08_04335 [Candidatus Babeliales bacterium]|nr:hypothetical protein [Candidatus Babeliales bacterium]